MVYGAPHTRLAGSNVLETYSSRKHSSYLSPPFCLPQELLDDVVSRLEIADTVSLALCNKGLWRKLGTRTNLWPLSRPGNRHKLQRMEILTRLARDNPAIFHCHICSQVHFVASVGPALRGFAQELELDCINYSKDFDWPMDSFGQYAGLSSYQLKVQQVHLAMSRQLNGKPYGIPLDMLSLTEVLRSDDPDVLTLLSVEPQIIEHELFLRVQHWMLIEKYDETTFRELYGPNICSHLERYSYPSSEIRELMKCALHVHKDKYCMRCHAIRKCSACATEFQSRTVEVEHGSLAIVITKWMNVGNGSSPDDPNWQRHLGSGQPRSNRVPQRDPRPGLKVRFEKHAKKRQVALTNENAAHLRSGAFRRKMHRIEDLDLWSSRQWPVFEYTEDRSS